MKTRSTAFLLLMTVLTASEASGAGEWGSVSSSPDPTKLMLESFRKAPAPTVFAPTGLGRADYLKLIAGEIDFWKQHQDAGGAIIDPYMKREHQYSTPAFADAAAALVKWSNRRDLVEPAAKALDWSTARLADRKAADGHEDFYPPMIAHAMALLKSSVPRERYARWEENVRRIDPRELYRMKPGSMNWNVVSSCGEALFQMMGLRTGGDEYVAESLGAQGRHFTSPWGLYVEGPMAYDLFPRMFLDDLLKAGYRGAYQKELDEMLGRGAITSLFMQSPWGELPAGGRSAHHQWNEAEQCAVFEIYAAKAQQSGDQQMAGVYKRAAHLAFRSMQRWVRPSGEMQIVKNWVDPAKRHGYEGYSGNTQYNLLPMSMLALACFHGEATRQVDEKPAPADVGGFVFEIPELHKIIANAGGTYIEIETRGDPHYDATGLIRVHAPGVSPQLGPSDSVLAHPAYQTEGGIHPETDTGIGVEWKSTDGEWKRLGGSGGDATTKLSVGNIETSPARVTFTVTYEGKLAGPSRVVERYALTPGRVELTTTLEGYEGPLRYVWPVLADDGRVKSQITTEENTVIVSQDGGKTAQTFSARGAARIDLGSELYPNHNGWVRLALAEFPAGGSITLITAPRGAADAD